MNADILGRGLALPLRTGPTGGIQMSQHAQKVRESILIILGTQPGERIMRPTFGCNLRGLVFAPNNSATANLARHYVEEALAIWEPRILVEEVKAFADIDPARLLIDIRYRLKATYDVQNLVYPFYLQPAT